MENNVLERGPLPSDPSIAVRIMEGAGAHPVNALVFFDNTLRNDTHAPLTFVLNWTGTTARMENNQLTADITPVSSWGYSWFLTKSCHSPQLGSRQGARPRHLPPFVMRALAHPPIPTMQGRAHSSATRDICH